MSKTQNNNLEVEEELLGAVVPLKATGDKVANIEELSGPLKWEQGVMRSFCKGCGGIDEITAKRANDLAGLAGADLPDDLMTVYFEISGCASCDGDRERAELKYLRH